MLLVFDVGNTNITIGLFDGDNLKTHWRIRTDSRRTCDEYGVLVKGLFDYQKLGFKEVRGVAISSVVPAVIKEIASFGQKYLSCQPLIIDSKVKTNLTIKYDNPNELGADRVVNAVAAYHKYGGPIIIVDFGTATTFCVVNEKGDYLGGAIAPGIVTATDALAEKAAKLPRVELIKPPSFIGPNTIASMQVGIIYGFAGQVEGIISRMKKEINGQLQVIATGGLAPVIAQETDVITIIDDFLTLEGLRLIYQMNRG
ncbi:MAG: type III pantothenate kinase [Syntrophomonadaceae bacterium]|jgi:type III pantothenate kinase